jgi:uncharacterized YigZ family protein
MKSINKYEYIVKKSRFIAYYYEIENVDEVKRILEDLKNDNKKARHMPYAYRLNNTAGKSDDKEPNNTAGMPIYRTLENNNLQNRLIVVVRYFGGVKLGAGGLTRAYLNAAINVIK